MTAEASSRLYFRSRSFVVLVLALLFIPLAANDTIAQDNRVTTANYELAARWTSAKIGKLVYSTSVNPRWLEHSDRFWYTFESPGGNMWYLVDPARKSKAPLFDNVRMAADLTRITKDPYDHQHLPIGSIEFVNNDSAIQFDVESSQDAPPDTSQAEEEEGGGRGRGGQGGRGQGRSRPEKLIFHFEYNLQTRQLRENTEWEEEEDHPDWASLSPDRNWAVFSRDFNLYMMDAENYEKARADEEDSTIVEHQITTDGEEHYGFGSLGRGRTEEQKEEARGKRQSIRVIWSPDSKKFALTRSDRRKVKDLWVINSLANPRPTLETYKYDMPGEEDVTQVEIFIFDVARRDRVQVDDDRFTDQTASIHTARMEFLPSFEGPRPSLWLSGNSSELYFSRTSRDLHRIDVCVADAETGDVRVVIEERLNTYVETQRLEILKDRNELIWWSERDGWGHYYLYGTDGALKRQLTSGPWSCRGINEVDEGARVVYFRANGREAGEDPYFEHLYRVGLDGSGLRLLTPGNFSHRVSMNDEGSYFVDTFSQVGIAPKSVLYDNRGQVLLELEEADLTRLMEAGFKMPETFKVKADDGTTDLYGVMYKPFDFDPTKKYPIIAYVYPGPQSESVSKTFSTSPSNTFGLAQFGFVVITVGNRGGHPTRSKWYHNYGYGDLRDYGLADKKTAIEQLAARHSFIDIDRVGIFGHSGGGFMSTAAMLVYPDFFKVAVSSSGNHDNSVYNKWWSEKHHGVKEVTDDEGNVTFEYDIDKNHELAANLKGRLLLTTGDIDNNVHPAGTLRMANALIRAGKRFDFFIFPGQRHGYGNMGNYWFWLKSDYFCKHLLGDYSASVDMIELLRDQDQSPDGGRGR
jgi:dipeptidyl aminopeptidase/acylaminoacyl peptidase